MLQILIQNKLKVLLFFFLTLLLISVRIFEKNLFYDPLLAFFKSSSSTKLLPELDYFSLFFGLLFRFFLNTIISLSIIYVIFEDFEITRFTAFLYVCFFIFLTIGFFVAISFFPEHKILIFYIRRFLIQPIFLLLFLPAFYFQKKSKI
jgi:exosortase F-associated protein